MIFIDANYFIRAIVVQVTPQDRIMADHAMTLFRRIAASEVEATTSEAILAEVIFILSSRRHFNLRPDEISARIKPFLQLPGLRLPQKRIYFRALDLYVSFPNLRFVDALCAAYSEQPGMELATFDRDFDRVPNLVRYQP
ncbi:MAG TPA: type II toxin-antitoxin system VapC family toxin [Thermomicrobiales bacterium]|nr:type II toxin-antitoxin system VapC family toxin [Thermomicrobiales bacterium]